MSLIFKALKKLKAQQPPKSEGKGSPLHKSSNVFSFGRIFFSPLVILLFFITGLLMYHMFQFLFSHMHEDLQPSVSVPATPLQPVLTQPSQQEKTLEKPIENLEIPNHPGNLPSAELQPVYRKPDEEPYLQNNAIYPEGDGSRIQYIRKTDISDNESSVIPETEIQETNPPQHQQTEPISNQNNRPFTDTDVYPDTGRTTQPWNERNENLRLPDNPQNRPLTKEEILLRAKIEKIGKIASIVSRIEENLKKQDYQQTEQLIETLSNLTEKNDPYLLKIKSFLYVKTGRYDLAENILKKMLATDKDDFETNINLAVIEIKTGKEKEAHSRLMDLAKIYPDNSTIQELIHRLQ